MAKYLRFIGIIELLGFAIGLIFAFISMITAFTSNSPTAMYALLIFLAVLVFGPAVGFLFLSVASLLDNESIRLQEEAEKLDKEQRQATTTSNQKDDSYADDMEKKALIAKHNFDKHLSESEVEELMRLPLAELKMILEKED